MSLESEHCSTTHTVVNLTLAGIMYGWLKGKLRVNDIQWLPVDVVDLGLVIGIHDIGVGSIIVLILRFHLLDIDVSNAGIITLMTHLFTTTLAIFTVRSCTASCSRRLSVRHITPQLSGIQYQPRSYCCSYNLHLTFAQCVLQYNKFKTVHSY